MHTASSANLTWSARASTSEWTATVFIPSSRHARRTRSAISPRFAIRIFLNIARRRQSSRLLDAEELLPVLDALAVLREDFGHGPRPLGLDFVHQLHRFDDAEGLPRPNHR